MGRVLGLLSLGVCLGACHLVIGHDPPPGRSDGRIADQRPGERVASEGRPVDLRIAPPDLGAHEPPPPTCPDGTAIGACSSWKPFRCDATLQLKADCSGCGCPSGGSCSGVGNGCRLVLASTRDSYAIGTDPATHGAEDRIRVGFSGVVNTDGYLAFDLSAIARTATTDSAILELDLFSWSNGTPLPVSFRLLSTPWDEADLCGTKLPTVISSPVANHTLGWDINKIDVKSLVHEWVTSGFARYGFQIRTTTKDSVSLASRETTTQTAPRLTITYH